jgi:hypothetical protein
VPASRTSRTALMFYPLHALSRSICACALSNIIYADVSLCLVCKSHLRLTFQAPMEQKLVTDIRTQQRYWQARPTEDPAAYASLSAPLYQPTIASPASIVDPSTVPTVAPVYAKRQPIKIESLPEAQIFSGDVLRMYQAALSRQLIGRDLM